MPINPTPSRPIAIPRPKAQSPSPYAPQGQSPIERVAPFMEQMFQQTASVWQAGIRVPGQKDWHPITLAALDRFEAKDQPFELRAYNPETLQYKIHTLGSSDLAEIRSLCFDPSLNGLHTQYSQGVGLMGAQRVGSLEAAVKVEEARQMVLLKFDLKPKGQDPLSLYRAFVPHDPKHWSETICELSASLPKPNLYICERQGKTESQIKDWTLIGPVAKDHLPLALDPIICLSCPATFRA